MKLPALLQALNLKARLALLSSVTGWRGGIAHSCMIRKPCV